MAKATTRTTGTTGKATTGKGKGKGKGRATGRATTGRATGRATGKATTGSKATGSKASVAIPATVATLDDARVQRHRGGKGSMLSARFVVTDAHAAKVPALKPYVGMGKLQAIDMLLSAELAKPVAKRAKRDALVASIATLTANMHKAAWATGHNGTDTGTCRVGHTQAAKYIGYFNARTKGQGPRILTGSKRGQFATGAKYGPSALYGQTVHNVGNASINKPKGPKGTTAKLSAGATPATVAKLAYASDGTAK